MEVAVNHTGVLQGKGVLHKEIAVDLTPEVSVAADDVAFDDGLLADNHFGLGNDTSLECAINPYVVGRCDLPFDH